MPRKKPTIVTLLKTHTDIDPRFIDKFLTHYRSPNVEEDEYEFHITDADVAEYLKVDVSTIRSRLQNKFSKKKIYYENVDFVTVYKDKSKRTITYLLSYSTFERLCMMGDTERAETVRLYFSKLRQFLTEKAALVPQALDNKTEALKIYEGFETIYLFAYKIGKSKKILERMQKYNVGRIHEIDLKYLAFVKNRSLKNA